MRFAPVCPIHIYEGLEQSNKKALGDYFLLLTHDVIANEERYANFFKDRDCTLILDNSVIELGDACTASALYRAANIVNATCVAIPDVLKQGERTLNAARLFLSEWKMLDQKKDFSLMFIPQGFNARDFEHCIHTAMVEFGDKFDWIGIPRNLTGRVYDSRETAVKYILSLNQYKLYQQKLHLLGFSDNVKDDMAVCHKFADEIEGIDSAVPLRMGKLAWKDLDQLPARGTWWEEVVMAPDIAANTLVARMQVGEL